MAARTRLTRLLSGSAWLYAALLLGVFGVSAIGGYVYQYELPRDRAVLRVDPSTPPATTEVIGGAVVEVTGEQLVIERDGQRIELSVPSGVLLEELRRSDEPLAPGTTVNVGAEQTDFGLVFTGIVAIEDGALEEARP